MKHILFIFEKDSNDAILPALNQHEWRISFVTERDIYSLLPIAHPFDLVMWMTSHLNISFVSIIQSKLLVSNIIVLTSSKDIDSRIRILKSGSCAEFNGVGTQIKTTSELEITLCSEVGK